MTWNTAAEWKAALDNVGMTDYFMDNQVPASLDDVLSNGNWEVIFHQYLVAEYSSENLDFLRAVATFESSGDLNQAAEIYKEFVATSAPRQVNLSGGTRTDLDAIFGEGGEGVGPPNLFDTAKNDITNLIKNDTFRRFKDSADKAQADMWSEGGRDRS